MRTLAAGLGSPKVELVELTAAPVAPTCSPLAGSAEPVPAQVGSGRFSAADFTSLFSLVLSGASGIRSATGHLIPEGEEEDIQKCAQTLSGISDPEQDADGTIQLC